MTLTATIEEVPTEPFTEEPINTQPPVPQAPAEEPLGETAPATPVTELGSDEDEEEDDSDDGEEEDEEK